ncbi:IS630 transposase-related protein [Symbiopectobacterium sp. RP]|uniref:IS630 transposase-related protein n=1 Tax=Symbiopectobacterium sp. RP TaxID=3248553 RepID=UPI003D2A3330
MILRCEDPSFRWAASIKSIYSTRPQIESKASTMRQRKIDKSELIKGVEQYPDAYQKERAERFGVCQKAIWQALKKLGLTYKKNSTSSESRRKRPASIPTKNTTV